MTERMKRRFLLSGIAIKLLLLALLVSSFAYFGHIWIGDAAINGTFNSFSSYLPIFAFLLITFRNVLGLVKAPAFSK